MALRIDIDRSSAVPLYAQLYRALKDSIRSGAIAYGQRLPSENELSAGFGLSRMTVRSALSQLASEKYIEKVQGKGAFACYRSPAITGSIDVLLDVSYTYFALRYIQSISGILKQSNYRFIIHDTLDSQAEICRTLGQVLAGGTAGIILQPAHRIEPPGPELRGLLSHAAAQGIPFVMLDRAYDGIPGPRVVVDEACGGRIAAEFLLSLGHRRCAMVCRSDYYENSPRREGFQAVLSERGLPPLLAIEQDGKLEGSLLEAIRAQGVTAVFCFNDETAVETMRLLRGAGVRIPEDVSLVGFDDTVIAEATDPPLTSVIHPKDALGRAAAERLIGIIEGHGAAPFDGQMKPSLHIRESCAKPRKKAQPRR